MTDKIECEIWDRGWTRTGNWRVSKEQDDVISDISDERGLCIRTARITVKMAPPKWRNSMSIFRMILQNREEEKAQPESLHQAWAYVREAPPVLTARRKTVRIPHSAHAVCHEPELALAPQPHRHLR